MQVDRTRLYRVSAVAQMLDVSKQTVYRAIESGELDALRIGKSVRIPGTALAAWLEVCGQTAAEHHVLAGEPVAGQPGAVRGVPLPGHVRASLRRSRAKAVPGSPHIWAGPADETVEVAAR